MGLIVAAVAAVASIVTAVAGPSQLLLAGLSIGQSLLSKKPKAPRASPESIDRLNASIDPQAFRKMVLGSTAMATDIRDNEYTDDQTYLHRFIVVAAHKINAVNEIWFDNKLAWSNGVVQGEFAGYLTVTPILEGSAGNAINISPRMGSSRRFTGCAYIHFRYKLTGNSKKQESPFAQGITSRITIKGDGAFMYDPRFDDTQPGGSGPQRADDQSTWVWNPSSCRNPAIQLLFYLLGWRINGILSVGRGVPIERIDIPSFIAAANICDEQVAIQAGGTEPRYRSDTVFSEGDDPSTVLDTLKASMNADLDDVGGRIRLTVFHDDLSIQAATFDKSHFIGEWTWTPALSLESTYNVIRGKRPDPSNEALYQQVSYPDWEIPSPDGIERAFTFNLPNVENPRQCERLAKLKGMRQLFGGTLECTLQAEGWRVAKNDVVNIPNPGRNWAVEKMRVAEIEHRVDGTVPMTLRVEDPAIYAWLPSEEGANITHVPASLYNPALDPVRQGILEATYGLTVVNSYAEGVSGNVTQSDNGTSATISIPAHARVYPAPYSAVSVNAGTVTAPYGVEGFVSYDDPELDGGPVTYVFYTNVADAYASPANPARHNVARVTALLSGGTGGSVGGPSLPGLGDWSGLGDFWFP